MAILFRNIKSLSRTADHRNVKDPRVVADAMIRFPGPPEIADQILEYVGEDRRTLAACGLACRAWLHTVRSHTFRDVKVRGHSDLMAFHDLLRATPALTFYVHVLTISTLRSRRNPLPSRAWANTVFKLERLEELSLVDMKVELTSEVVHLFRQGYILPQIHTLRLHAVRGDRGSLRLLLDALPGIQSLSVYLITETRSLADAARSLNLITKTHSAPSQRLSPILTSSAATVQVIPAPLTTMVCWGSLASQKWLMGLLHHRGTPQLRELMLWIGSSHPECPAQQLIAQGADTLESICLDFSNWKDPVPWQESADLRRCHRLSQLRLDAVVHPRAPHDTSWRSLLAALADTPSQHKLELISITMWVNGRSFIEVAWSLLDIQLARLAEAHPQLTIAFYAIPTTRVDPDTNHSDINTPATWMSDFPDVLEYLPQLLASGARLSLAWFSSYGECEQYGMDDLGCPSFYRQADRASACGI